MKNLEKELQKISKLPIGFDQDNGDYGKFYFNDLYELFSKTIGYVIGKDDTYEETSASYTNNNLRNLQRARKKELGLWN